MYFEWRNEHHPSSFCDQATSKAIDTVLTECCVNPQYFIKYIGDPLKTPRFSRGSPMAVCGYKISMRKGFSKTPYFHWTTAHEAMHCLHHDGFETDILLEPIEKNNPSLYTRFMKFQEKRADILGALISLDSAFYAAQMFNTKNFKFYDHYLHQVTTLYPIHPTDLERFYYLRKLYYEMCTAAKQPIKTLTVAWKKEAVLVLGAIAASALIGIAVSKLFPKSKQLSPASTQTNWLWRLLGKR